VLATGRILSSAAAADYDDDAGERAAKQLCNLQYTCLLHARVVTIYVSLKCAMNVCGGSVLAITWTGAVISC